MIVCESELNVVGPFAHHHGPVLVLLLLFCSFLFIVLYLPTHIPTCGHLTASTGSTVNGYQSLRWLAPDPEKLTRTALVTFATNADAMAAVSSLMQLKVQEPVVLCAHSKGYLQQICSSLSLSLSLSLSFSRRSFATVSWSNVHCACLCCRHGCFGCFLCVFEASAQVTPSAAAEPIALEHVTLSTLARVLTIAP